ncbi:MAG: BrnT family toxin [Pirellulales bacterium]|nr:BrnT family toxin [Pirellulales bacterium]
MASPLDQLATCTGFDWDEGNTGKNWIKHQVSPAECEELFFNEPLVVAPDVKHSQMEPRFYLLGRTDEGRRLFAVFTIRDSLVRVISARDMNRHEKKEYERAQAKETDA